MFVIVTAVHPSTALSAFYSRAGKCESVLNLNVVVAICTSVCMYVHMCVGVVVGPKRDDVIEAHAT